MKNKKRRVGIIGCGVIFPRHLEAINDNNEDYEIVAVADIDPVKAELRAKELGIKGFTDYKEMLSKMKGKMDFVSICTPNSMHYEHAIESLSKGYDILVEKPIAFEASKVKAIAKKAKEQKLRAYAVLQVRLNPTVRLVHKLLKKNIVGDIRSVSLIQRWQRPESYFESWRADINIGGRTLYEVGIHYMDIMQMLFGVPEVTASTTFSNKHKKVAFEDTVFSILRFPSGASGSLEITIASEPKNLECSLAVLGSRGYIKIGGKALDSIDITEFSSPSLKKMWDQEEATYEKTLDPNSYGLYAGSCPNHPSLYKEIVAGRGFDITESINVVKFIQDAYDKEVK